MGTPRLYSCDDAGAPVLNDTGHLAYTIIKQLLDACLVTGYGDKPAAGWSRIADSGTGVAYRSASGKTIALIRAYGVYGVSIALMDYAGGTDPDTWLSGENIRSGSSALTPASAASAAYHRFSFYGTYEASYRSLFRWCVAADAETFILSVSNANTTGASDWTAQLYVGEYINYSGLTGKATVVAMGGLNTSSAPAATASYSSPFTSGCTLLRHPVSGLMSFPWLYPCPNAYVNGNANRTFGSGDVIPVSLNLSPLPLRLATYSDGGYYRIGGHVGRLKGAVVDPVLMDYSWMATHQVLGLPLTYEGFCAIAVASDGYGYAPVTSAGDPESSTAGSGEFNLILTDNPAFW